MLRASTFNLQKQRAVIVAGSRTPFVKSFGELLKVDTIGLGAHAVDGLLKKTKLDLSRKDLDAHLIWGNVVMMTSAPNCAKEIGIDLHLPPHIPMHSTSMACASGLNAVIQASMMIEAGHADCIIAGGSDSVSNGEIPLPRKLGWGLAQFVYGKKKGLAAIPEFGKYAGWNPMGWLPTPPSITERSTGKTMGWHGDIMAELNKVGRADQEALAIASHKNASKARAKLAEEIHPYEIDLGGKKGKKIIATDNLVKDDWEKMPEKLPSLKPAFRKPDGTVTAATSSALTDGASAVLVMSEAKAKQLGYPTDVSLASWAYTSIDPFPQLLLAPALGWPKALAKAGLKLRDIDLFEVHEAFAAQVLVTLKVLASQDFCQRFLGLDAPFIKDEGDMNFIRERLNVNGGSIAIGHPFAATGGRIVTAATNELRRSDKQHCLISICAAGGLGAVGVVSRQRK